MPKRVSQRIGNKFKGIEYRQLEPESQEGSMLTTTDIPMIVAKILHQTGVPNPEEPGDQELEGQGNRSSGASSGTGLSHVREMDDYSDTETLTDDLSTTSFLDAAFPHKLVKRIESGAFVDMGELLPGNLTLIDDELKQKPKHYRVSSITEWLQGFTVYVAVLSSNQPARIPDLMGYQLLILEAYNKFRNDCWLGYDRWFRQWAAFLPWAATEPTLWSLAFQGQARSSHCKHCF